MKALSLLLLGGLSAILVSQSGTGSLAAHQKAMQEAPSLTATLTVLPIGGAPATWKASFSKPNFFRIENPEGLVQSDGKTLFKYSKKDNSWTETALSEELLVKESGIREIWAWRAFFDKDAFKAVLSTKAGVNRVIKGVPVSELVLNQEGPAVTLLIDPKLGYARGFTFKYEETDLMVTATEIEVGKEPLSAEKFAFTAPAGATKAEAAASGAPTFAAVQALFQRTCMPCHSAARRSGGHNLGSYAGIARGVVAGNPQSSPIYIAISGNPPRMPQMRTPLTAAELELVSKWIEAGAKQN